MDSQPKWPYPYVLFTPVVEDPEYSPDPMVPETPHDVYAGGRAGNMTWITTMTKQEGHFALLCKFFCHATYAPLSEGYK